MSSDELPKLGQVAGNKWEVEKIVGKRSILGSYGAPELQYLVKWLHYRDDENTWEPVDNLTGSMGAIWDYEIAAQQERESLRQNPLENPQDPTPPFPANSAAIVCEQFIKNVTPRFKKILRYYKAADVTSQEDSYLIETESNDLFEIKASQISKITDGAKRNQLVEIIFQEKMKEEIEEFNRQKPEVSEN